MRLDGRLERFFEVPLAKVAGKEWTCRFENAAVGDDALAIAEYLCSTNVKLKLTPAARAKILGAAAGIAMDLCLAEPAERFVEAYLNSEKTSAKVQRVLQKRLLGLKRECERSEATIAAVSQGKGTDVSEEGWRAWVRHCTRRVDLTPIATSPTTGAFLAYRMNRTISDKFYFQTPAGSSEMIVYFDGASLQPPPFSYQFEGTLKGEHRVDTSLLVEEAPASDEVLWMKKKDTFSHVQRFGKNIRFYATHSGGGFTSQQEIKHRFWLRCDTDANADLIMSMAHASSWSGTPVVGNLVGTNLVLEYYYGSAQGHLARFGCVVVDDDWEHVAADRPFERERFVDFLKAFRTQMQQPYPLIEDYLAGDWATDPGGLAWVRRFPSEEAAIDYYDNRRLEYWRRGSRLWSYLTLQLA